MVVLVFFFCLLGQLLDEVRWSPPQLIHFFNTAPTASVIVGVGSTLGA